MFQNEVKHVVLMPSSTNLDINKEVTHNTRQNNKIVGTQYREIPTTTTTDEMKKMNRSSEDQPEVQGHQKDMDIQYHGLSIIKRGSDVIM